MLVWYKSITNRQDKKWECEGKKRKRGIDVEERIGVTAKTIFLLQQTLQLQLRGTLSLPRDWEFLPKVLYQLVQDFFYETLYPLEQKRVCFAFMINTRWWERGGNGAKREQYLDWWNKNWLETRLSQNPLIFFICSSSIIFNLQDSNWAISLLRDWRGKHCCAQICSSYEIISFFGFKEL